MISRVLAAFLERQEEDARSLNAESDLVEVTPMEPTPCRRYLVHYKCSGLVRTERGVEEARDFRMGVFFPEGYLAHVQPWECLTWLWPINTFQPAIRFPFICPGVLTPGTPLLEIVQQCMEILTYQKVTMAENNALNKEACAWTRLNKWRLPIDGRPLRRRTVRYRVESRGQDGASSTHGPAGEES